MDENENARLREEGRSAARNGLQLLVAPSFGSLDCSPPVGIGREQCGLGTDRLQRTRDRSRSLHPPPVDLQRRNGGASEAREPKELRMKPGHEVLDLMLDALALQHQPCRMTGMGKRERVERRGHLPGSLFRSRLHRVHVEVLRGSLGTEAALPNVEGAVSQTVAGRS